MSSYKSVPLKIHLQQTDIYSGWVLTRVNSRLRGTQPTELQASPLQYFSDCNIFTFEFPFEF